MHATGLNCAGHEVANVLHKLARASDSSLELEPAVWQSMSAAVDADSSGAVEWRELVTFFCDVFKHIYREQKLNELAEDGVTALPNEHLQHSIIADATVSQDKSSHGTDLHGGEETGPFQHRPAEFARDKHLDPEGYVAPTHMPAGTGYTASTFGQVAEEAELCEESNKMHETNAG
jgi:hypothetical protein